MAVGVFLHQAGPLPRLAARLCDVPEPPTPLADFSPTKHFKVCGLRASGHQYQPEFYSFLSQHLKRRDSSWRDQGPGCAGPSPADSFRTRGWERNRICALRLPPAKLSSLWIRAGAGVPSRDAFLRFPYFPSFSHGLCICRCVISH